MEKEKQEIINKLFDAIQTEAVFVRENTELSSEAKLLQVDVLLDVQHFLKDYEQNVKILNEYNIRHRLYRCKEKEGKEI